MIQKKRSNGIKKVLTPFIEARGNGRLAFLVGAGISRDPPANRPLANEISRTLIEGFWRNSIITKKWSLYEGILQKSSKVRFERLVQLVADTTGSNRFLCVVKGGRPNRLHRSLARALKDGCPVLTTNFDQLIERAYNTNSSLEILVNSKDFQKKSKRTPRGVLAKLHGSIEVEGSLCASLNQVGALGPAFMWDPPRGKYLERVRKKFPLAILGYSGADDADIIPRLRITKSDQLLLWVLHEGSHPRLANSADIKRLATAPGLSEYLHESKAIVVVGSTRTVLASLEMRPPPPSPLPTKLEWLQNRILRYMGWRSAPLLYDFLFARILYESGFPEVSVQLFSAVRAKAELEHPHIAVRCLVNEATADTDLGRWSMASKKLDVALPNLRQLTDDLTYANALLNRAVILRHTSDIHAAEKALRSILKAFQGQSELKLEWARAASNLADILFEQGELDEAQRLLKRIRMVYKAVGDQSGMATVFGIYGKILFARDDPANALGVLQIALWHARVAGDKTTEARLINHVGTIQRVLCMLDKATESFKNSRKLGIEISDPEPVLVSQMGMVTVDLSRGNLDRATWRAKRCLKKAEMLGLRNLSAQTRGNLALALLNAGHPSEALSHFKRILPIFEEIGPSDFKASTLQNIGECLFELGRDKEAKHILEQAIALYNNLGSKEKDREAKHLIENRGCR